MGKVPPKKKILLPVISLPSSGIQQISILLPEFNLLTFAMYWDLKERNYYYL